MCYNLTHQYAPFDLLILYLMPEKVQTPYA
jgi:hypothetical protein